MNREISIETSTRLRKVITIAIVGGFLLAIFGPGMNIVPPGHRGVVLYFGKPVEVANEGLYLWFPHWSKSVVHVSVQTQKFEQTMDSTSQDQQQVTATIAINYHLLPSRSLDTYQRLRLEWEYRILQPNIEEAVKVSMAMFKAEDLIKQRQVVKEQIVEGFMRRINTLGWNENIVIETVSLTNIVFSELYSQAIEAKVIAEQDAMRERNVLVKVQIQAEQRVAEAEGMAIAEVTRANGTARSRVITADAEAQALRMLRQELTGDLLDLKSIEAWNGKLPIILVTGEGNTPFIVDIDQLLGNTTSRAEGATGP